MGLFPFFIFSICGTLHVPIISIMSGHSSLPPTHIVRRSIGINYGTFLVCFNTGPGRLFGPVGAGSSVRARGIERTRDAILTGGGAQCGGSLVSLDPTRRTMLEL